MNRLYERLLEVTHDGVYRYTLDEGKILFANQGFVNTLGLEGTPEDLIGKRLSDLRVCPEKDGAVRAKLESAGEIHGFEYYFQTLQGAARWVLHDGYVVEDIQTRRRVVDALVRDISDLKKLAQAQRELESKLAADALLRSEERYHRLVELCPDAIFIGRNERVVFVNSAMLRLLGATAPEQVIGMSLWDLHPPGFHAIIRARIQQQLASGQPVPLLEEAIVRLDGAIRQVEVAAAPFADENGPAFQVVVRDITERKRTEQALRDARADLERRVQERTTQLTEANTALQLGITERTRVAEALVASEARYRNLFESMDEGFAACEMIYDTAGTPVNFRYLDVNPAFSRLTGLPAERAVGSLVTELIPGVEPFWIEMYGRVVESGKSTRVESNLHGLGKHFEVFAWRTGQGRFACVFNDVTGHRQAEARIQHLNDLLRAIRDINELIVREKNTRKLLEQVCQILVRTRGYRLAWIGRPEADSMRVTPVAQAGDGQNVLAHTLVTWDGTPTGQGPMGRAIRERAPAVCQDIAIDPRCAPWRQTLLAIRVGAVAAVPILYAGNLFGALTVCADRVQAFEDEELDLLSQLADDIAFALSAIQHADEQRRAEEALRRAEARFRTLTEKSSDGIVLFNAEGTALYVSPACGRVFGINPDDYVGRNMREWVHPDDLRDAAAQFAQLVREPGGSRHVHFRARRKDGLEVWIEAIGTNLLADPAVGAIVTNNRNVTDRKQAEDEAQTLRKELFHAARVTMLGELTGMIAHELNQPLAAIRFNAEAAQRLQAAGKLEEKELRQILAEIVEDDQRAAQVISRLRSLLKKGEIERQPLDFNAVVHETAALLKSELSTGLTATFDLAPDLPLVLADRVHLGQVILNLLGNALQAMQETPPEKRRLCVRTRRLDERTLQLAVEDSGVSIATGDLARIFEPFFTTKQDGLGMGLRICRSIIEAHGGRIWASNNASEGATVQFTLPIPSYVTS